MKKVLILIAMIALPSLFFGQAAPKDILRQNEIMTVANLHVKNDHQTVLSASAKAELNDLNYKKSNELISIKAYRKSLQIKVKEIKNC